MYFVIKFSKRDRNNPEHNKHFMKLMGAVSLFYVFVVVVFLFQCDPGSVYRLHFPSFHVL